MTSKEWTRQITQLHSSLVLYMYILWHTALYTSVIDHWNMYTWEIALFGVICFQYILTFWLPIITLTCGHRYPFFGLRLCMRNNIVWFYLFPVHFDLLTTNTNLALWSWLPFLWQQFQDQGVYLISLFVSNVFESMVLIY